MATTIIPYLADINNNKVIILASASPRRKEILQNMGFQNIIVRSSSFEEDLNKESYSKPMDYCLATASEKGKDVIGDMLSKSEWKENMLLISADTIVEINNKILEKPSTKEEAKSMLNLLSGNVHTVHTGVAIYSGKIGPMGSSRANFSLKRILESTVVKFNKLSAQDIEAYIATGEPFDKAGGYGIQGIGANLVHGIQGCYFNVMGLPVHALSQTIAEMYEEELM